MRGRIFESKNMAHAGVDSATRACEPSASWVRAREALARGCGRRVLKAVLGAHVRIRMWRQRGRGAACFREVVRMCGAVQTIFLACYII